MTGGNNLLARIAPDPDAPNVRRELVSQDIMDALTYCATIGWDSFEVYWDATLDDIAYGNGRVHGHMGSSSSRYYTHYDDPDWAVIHSPDGDAKRGAELLAPWLVSDPPSDAPE